MFPDPAFHIRDRRVVDRYHELIATLPVPSPPKPVEPERPLLPAPVIRLELETGLRVRVVFPNYDVAMRAWSALDFRHDLVQPTPETLIMAVPTSDAVRYKQVMHTLSTLRDVSIDAVANAITNPPDTPMAPIPSLDQRKRERSWDHSFSLSLSS